jgi:hypothetical protein
MIGAVTPRAGDALHPERLEDKQRTLRDTFLFPLTLRTRRALSWLRQSAHRQGGGRPRRVAVQR